MPERDRLRARCNDDLVRAHLVAHPQRMDADLATIAAAGRVTADHQLRVRAHLLNGPCQQQRRSTGNVHLAVVMPLHDLDVRVGEQLRRLSGHIREHRDGRRHVRREENRDPRSRLRDGGALKFRLAGRGNDQRQVARARIIQ